MARDLGVETSKIVFENFKGINNVADPSNLDTEELVQADNVDIDNEGRVSRRNGYTKKYTATDTLHSLWSNDRICLFVEGTTLKKLNTDYTATNIRSNVGSEPMSYVDINENVYYSNASVNGFVDSLGNDNQFSDPNVTYKEAPKPGQHLEYYNGRLYIARNQTIWYSDAYAFNRIDMRSNVIQMKDEITMMKAVSDGIYVSIGDINDRSSVIFLQGSTPSEFISRPIFDYGAIEGSPVKCKGAFIGDGNEENQVVIWASHKGICIGANGGKARNITATRYEVPSNRYGAGFFRIINGVPQYLTSLWS